MQQGMKHASSRPYSHDASRGTEELLAHSKALTSGIRRPTQYER